MTETKAEITHAQNARAQAFAETLDAYSPASADETQVIVLLREYRRAFNASDLGRIEALLSSDFDLRYYDPQGKGKYIVSVQGHTMYLEKRSAWSTQRPRGEQLIMNVRSVLLHPEANAAVVIAATTYKSKYFHPRYTETFGFKKSQDGWRLRRILVIPAEPKPEELDVQIILSRFPGGRSPIGDFDKIVKEEGPDAFVERYQKRSRSGIPSYESVHSVLFVFAEPPAPGTRIVTQHQFRRPGMGALFPYRFTYHVPDTVSPFYIIENTSQAGGRPEGSITYSVFVDDVLVAKKKVRIR